MEADGVRSLVLRRSNGAALPAWEPGAHIDVLIRDDSARQYSLCGDPADLRCYRIAVLREADGRGGSRWIHDSVSIGDMLRIRPPRNHFKLEPAPAYTFVAGGIGITPILPMVKAAARSETPMRLVYGGRSRSSMAFLSELDAYSEHVEILAEDDAGLPDIAALVNRLRDNELLYVCGPTGLIDAVRKKAEDAGVPNRIRFELFSAPPSDDIEHTDENSFEVELRRSGLTINVAPNVSVLSAIRAAGVEVLSDCEDGICGSCETAVLQGRVEHRDQVLTADEQRENKFMMVCVSRSVDGRLVLDL